MQRYSERDACSGTQREMHAAVLREALRETHPERHHSGGQFGPIRGHQRPSGAIRGHQKSSEAIRCHQSSSVIISGHQWHQRQSVSIRAHQWPSTHVHKRRPILLIVLQCKGTVRPFVDRQLPHGLLPQRATCCITRQAQQAEPAPPVAVFVVGEEIERAAVHEHASVLVAVVLDDVAARRGRRWCRRRWCRRRWCRRSKGGRP